MELSEAVTTIEQKSFYVCAYCVSEGVKFIAIESSFIENVEKFKQLHGTVTAKEWKVTGVSQKDIQINGDLNLFRLPLRHSGINVN